MTRVSVSLGLAFVGLLALAIWITSAHATNCTGSCKSNTVCQGDDQNKCYKCMGR